MTTVLLVDRQIRSAMACRDIAINPIIDGSLQPASWDVHLGNHFTLYDDDPELAGVPLDPFDVSTHHTTSFTVDDEDIVLLPPGHFILGTTLEHVKVSECIVAILSGCSTDARAALVIENAGYVDNGFEGQLTLEIKNMHHYRTLRLRPGMKIGQLAFIRTLAAERPYGHKDLGSHYQGQTGATPPVALRNPTFYRKPVETADVTL